MNLFRTMLTVCLAASWSAFNTGNLKAQVIGDECPDVEFPITGTWDGLGAANEREQAESQAHEAALTGGCAIANKLADDLLKDLTCPEYCEQEEKYWDYCGEESIISTDEHCGKRGSLRYLELNNRFFEGMATEEWLCATELEVGIKIYLYCEPENIQP